MDKKTLKALKGSIKKWEGIVAGKEVDLGTDNCPLCLLFNNWGDWDGDSYVQCKGCPVAEEVGKKGCNETPYEDWCEAGFYELPDPSAERYSEAKRLATAELNFLKSLLPKEPKRASTTTTTKRTKTKAVHDPKQRSAGSNRRERRSGTKAKRPSK